MSLYKEHMKTRPKIEDIIPEFVGGSLQKQLLDFVAWMQKNKMKLGIAGANLWNAKCKGKSIFGVALGRDYGRNNKTWGVSLNLNNLAKYEDDVINEGLQEIVWRYIRYCAHCSRCTPGMDMALLGKEFKNICSGLILFINDPDEIMLNGIKRLIELEKQVRVNAKSSCYKRKEVNQCQSKKPSKKT